MVVGEDRGKKERGDHEVGWQRYFICQIGHRTRNDIRSLPEYRGRPSGATAVEVSQPAACGEEKALNTQAEFLQQKPVVPCLAYFFPRLPRYKEGCLQPDLMVSRVGAGHLIRTTPFEQAVHHTYVKDADGVSTLVLASGIFGNKTWV